MVVLCINAKILIGYMWKYNVVRTNLKNKKFNYEFQVKF